MSGSIDHHMKLWNIQSPKIIKAIESSDNFPVNIKLTNLKHFNIIYYLN